MGKFKKLEKKIKNCKKCPLWRGAKNAVPGEGPEDTKIMFVGEAPGRKEDLTGRPFVGRAGKLLTQLMEQVGIKRENVFITSVVKHRPPQNRKPNKEEINACLPYLKKQIEIISPKKIVILGRTAFDEVIGLGELKDCRGKWLKIKNRFYLCTYHPAAGLRSPHKVKKILEEDFKKIKRFKDL